MRKTETTKTSSKLWLNITLNRNGNQVQFGLPLDYFVTNGNEAQKGLLEALSQQDAGKHDLSAEEGWKVEASFNIIGEKKNKGAWF